MRDLLEEYQSLAAHGPVGRAVVTRVWGSAPRGPGGCLLATAGGEMAGSVSGGCVEGAAVQGIQQAIAEGRPRIMTWTVTHDQAWEVGLACGGTIHVLVEPSVRESLRDAAASEAGSVLATPLAGPAFGSALLIREDGTTEPLDGFPEPAIPACRDEALATLGRLSSTVVTLDLAGTATEVFLEVLPRRPVLLLIGAVHIAAELVYMARPLGYRVIVADGREGFLTRERFPDADELLLAWPEEVFQRVPVTSATAICVLSHDPKFDEPALDLALRSPAGYIGAIGSKATQKERRERLRTAGFDDATIGRLHGPIGLDIGGREPGEIALAILAEITAARYNRTPPPR